MAHAKQREPSSITAVVVGGGLAGVACAQELAKGDASVVLVDAHDYHQFQPLLYQVATSQLPARDIARPLRVIFKDEPNVEVVLAEVASVRFADRAATLADGRVLTGDVLVLAAGAQPNFFGITGAAEHAFPLYSVADAERLRRHVQSAVQHREGSPGEPLGVVIVGGGATGVETSGALSELFAALVSEGRLKSAPQVHLVDRGSALLPQFSPEAHTYAARVLTRDGVVLHLGTGVSKVGHDHVELDDGTTIAANAVVWAGGESGAPVAQKAGRPPGRGGRVDVRPDLAVDGFADVYAVGDVANIPGPDGATLPQLGSVAQQSGRWAGRNILAKAAGHPTQPFAYKDKGIMAMIGRNSAVAEVGKHRHEMEGRFAFAAWLGVHAMLLSGVHSRTDAFLEWGWDYVDRDHAAIVESQSTPTRIAWSDAGEGEEPHIEV
jgi:NADH:ubiquinone reductase (H+-translocating)